MSATDRWDVEAIEQETAWQERERAVTWCAPCGGNTNHTTHQHLEAMTVLCRACNEVEVQDEDRLCGECLSAQAEMYQPDEGGND